MVLKDSLIERIDYTNKLIYINEMNWKLAWQNLFTKKQPYKLKDKCECIPSKAIFAISQIYKFITLTEVFDNSEENYNLNKGLKQNLYSLVEDGYIVIYESQVMISKFNYKEYLLDKLEKHKISAIQKNEICDEDDDIIKEYKKSIILEIKETYNNLMKFL